MTGPSKLLKALFERRLRGFRVIELVGFVCLCALVLGVYAFKAGAGAEGAQIADTTRQIAAEQRRVRALKAELAHLEAPDRLERLAVRYLGMAPVQPRKEAEPDDLALLAAAPAAPAPSSAPAPAQAGALSPGPAEGARR
jgi:hypothetical protein